MPFLAPKVRDDLEYIDQVIDGDDMVLVRDPIRSTYFKFNPLQAAMLRALDGNRTAADITEQLSIDYDVEVPVAAAERFIARARDLLLLDITCYSVTPEIARKEVRKALRKAGFRLRAPDAKSPEPPRALTAESLLFAEAFRQLDLGHPRAAAGYLAEILQKNPNNARAKQVYDLIQHAYIRAAGGALTEFPSWVLFDPSRLLTWFDRLFGRFLFSWVGVLAMIAFGYLGIMAFMSMSFDGLRAPDAVDLIVGFGVLLLSSLLHELGHGLACRHYGGKVPEIGLMLMYYLIPSAFCDTSSSYEFTDRRQKVMVQLAGTIVSLLLLAGLLIALALISPNVPGYNGVVIATLFDAGTLATNLNPFMKLDGYFALSDILQFPNLRDRSFNVTRAWFGKWMLGLDLPMEDLPPRTRRLLIAYAVTSVVTTVWFLSFFYLALITPLVEHLRFMGLVVAVLLTAYLLRNLVLRNLWRAGRLLIKERRSAFTRRRTPILLGLVGLAIAPWFIQWPVLVDATFTVMPQERADVRPQTTGRVEEILVQEGDHVKRGQPLAILGNPELRVEIAKLEAELEGATEKLAFLENGATPEELALARRRLEQAASEQSRTASTAATASKLASAKLGTQADADAARGRAAGMAGSTDAAKWALTRLEAGARPEDIAVGHAEVARIEGELAHLRDEADRLTLRSPIDGVVVTPHLEDKLQTKLAPGDLFAEVHDSTTVVAEISLSLSDPLAEVEVGDEVVLKPYGAPHGDVSARVARIRDAAQTEHGEHRIIVVTTPFALDRPVSGFTGHARIYGAKRSLAYANVYLPLQRLLNVKVWSL